MKNSNFGNFHLLRFEHIKPALQNSNHLPRTKDFSYQQIFPFSFRECLCNAADSSFCGCIWASKLAIETF